MVEWAYYFHVPISSADDMSAEIKDVLSWLRKNFQEEYSWDITYVQNPKDPEPQQSGLRLCLEIRTNDVKDAMLLKLSYTDVIQL